MADRREGATAGAEVLDLSEAERQRMWKIEARSKPLGVSISSRPTVGPYPDGTVTIVLGATLAFADDSGAAP